MNTNRRVGLLVAGLLILCSAGLPWIGNSSPASTSFGSMFTNALTAISGGNLVVHATLLDGVMMSIILFVVAAIVLFAAVLSVKAIAIGSMIIALLTVLMWLFNGGVSIAAVFGSPGSMGLGTVLALVGVIIGFLAILLPKIKLPGAN